MNRNKLSNDNWAWPRSQVHLPCPEIGAQTKDYHLFVEEALWILRTRSPCPVSSGDGTVHKNELPVSGSLNANLP